MFSAVSLDFSFVSCHDSFLLMNIFVWIYQGFFFQNTKHPVSTIFRGSAKAGLGNNTIVMNRSTCVRLIKHVLNTHVLPSKDPRNTVSPGPYDSRIITSTYTLHKLTIPSSVNLFNNP